MGGRRIAISAAIACAASWATAAGAFWTVPPPAAFDPAVADALERGHLRGVALDVYDGEFEHPPPARLWNDPRVLITPHISGGSDQTSWIPASPTNSW